MAGAAELERAWSFSRLCVKSDKTFVVIGDSASWPFSVKTQEDAL